MARRQPNETQVEPGDSLGNEVLDLFSGTPDSMGNHARPPDTCAACGDGAAIQWLRMITDWEEYLCGHVNADRPDDVCLIPLCNRCRAWAEILEIAEMAIPHIPNSEARRIRQERNRFLESLDVNLVRGLRVSRQLSSFGD